MALSKAKPSRKRLLVVPGERYGHVEILGDAAAGNGHTSVFIACHACGARPEKSYRLHSIKAGLVASCGCLAVQNRKTIGTKHGLSKSGLYSSWLCMKKRCDNPKHRCAHLYQERGISYSPPWGAFEIFAAEMGAEYFDGAILDRNDNDLGYSKENCRLVDGCLSAFNRRPVNKTGCAGVVFLKSRNKWRASITKNYKTNFLGEFSQLGDAVAVRLEAEIALFGEYCVKDKEQLEYLLALPRARLEGKP